MLPGDQPELHDEATKRMAQLFPEHSGAPHHGAKRVRTHKGWTFVLCACGAEKGLPPNETQEKAEFSECDHDAGRCIGHEDEGEPAPSADPAVEERKSGYKGRKKKIAPRKKHKA